MGHKKKANVTNSDFPDVGDVVVGVKMNDLVMLYFASGKTFIGSVENSKLPPGTGGVFEDTIGWPAMEVDSRNWRLEFKRGLTTKRPYSSVDPKIKDAVSFLTKELGIFVPKRREAAMKKIAQSLKGLDIFEFVTLVAPGFQNDPRVKREHGLANQARAAMEEAIKEWKKMNPRLDVVSVFDEHFDARSQSNAIREIVSQWKEEGSGDQDDFDARYAPRGLPGRRASFSEIDRTILRIASKNREVRRVLIAELKSRVK